LLEAFSDIDSEIDRILEEENQWLIFKK
jgi:hypothetical protein